ncbi:MAG: hypothetical protein HOC71_07440 [Candidatus Latescibacteria bacterium]|jgi:hypothetical protein|nr:hypothetical protein [Candidatus Latescibacterota bacterium]
MKLYSILIFQLLFITQSVWCGVIKGTVTVTTIKPKSYTTSYSRGVFEPKIKTDKETQEPSHSSQQIKIVVWAEPIGKSPPFIQPDEKPLLNQKNKAFVPDLLVIQAGTTVGFPNLDPIYHNVFSYSRSKKFDLGHYKQNESKDVTFGKEGVVEVFCEIHENMHAYIIIINTPYFTQAGDKGEYRIEIPAGKYTIRAWSPDQEREISEIELGDTEEINLDFSL